MQLIDKLHLQECPFPNRTLSLDELLELLPSITALGILGQAVEVFEASLRKTKAAGTSGDPSIKGFKYPLDRDKPTSIKGEYHKSFLFSLRAVK
jgi:hypothetical protein